MTKAFSGWLAPAFGSAIVLKPDLDQVEGLAAEREALWARLNAATFLTVNEKRAAVGYAPVDISAPDATTPEAKAGYDPNQPRVPAGSSDGGQWTDGGGGGGSSSSGRVRVAGRGTALMRGLLKSLFGPKPKAPQASKTPEFLIQRSAPGKIKGKVDDLTGDEKRFVEELKDLGNDVEIIPRGKGRTPDFKINGKPTEYKIIKELKSTDENGLSKAIGERASKGRSQSGNLIIDSREVPNMTIEAAERGIRRAYGSDVNKRINNITVLTPEGPISVPRLPESHFRVPTGR